MIDYKKQTYKPHTIADFKLPVNAVFFVKYNSDKKQKKCYTFDNNGYLLTEESFKDKQLDSHKSYKYSGNYRLDEIIETNADGQMVLTVVYHYNEGGKLVDIVHKQQNHLLNYQVTNEYDKNNKLVKKTIYDITGNRFVRQIYYDEFERITERHIFDHLENKITYKFYHKYDHNNCTIQINQIPEQDSGTRVSCEMNYSYDSNGGLATQTGKHMDASTTVFKYSDNGEIIEVLDFDSENRITGSHSYISLSENSEKKIILFKTYDQSGNLLSEDFLGLNSHPKSIQMMRDNLGRITAELKIYSDHSYSIEDYDLEEDCFKDSVCENNQTDDEEETEIIEEHLAIKKDFGSYKKYEECIRHDFPDFNYDEPKEPECVYRFMEIKYHS